MVLLRRLLVLAEVLVVALALVLTLLVGGLNYWLSSTALSLNDLRLDDLNVKVRRAAQVDRVLWRQLYEFSDLELSDPWGGWKVVIPALRLEIDPLRSLFSRKLLVRSMHLTGDMRVEISPWWLRQRQDAVVWSEIVARLEQVSRWLTVDGIELQQLQLRVYDRERKGYDEYLLSGRYSGDSQRRGGILLGYIGERRVLQLRGLWQAEQGWNLQFEMDDMPLTAALDRPLAALGLEQLRVSTKLRFLGDSDSTVERAAGSLQITLLEAETLPWPVRVELAGLQLSELDFSHSLPQMAVRLESLEGYLGEHVVAVNGLILQLATEPDELRLYIARQELYGLVDFALPLLTLPDDIAINLREFAPAGEVHNLLLRLPLASPQDFVVTAQLRALESHPTRNNWPGISGLAGELYANLQGGVLHLRDVREAVLSIPTYFPPWNLTDVTGSLSWRLYPDSVLISGDNLRLRVDGSPLWGMVSVVLPFRSDDEPARLEALMQGQNLEASLGWQYTPRLPGLDGLIAYLRESLQGGKVNLEGVSVWADLEANEGFGLHMLMNAKDAKVQYAPSWPPLTAGSGRVEVLRDRVFIESGAGLLGGIQVQSGQVQVLPVPNRAGWMEVQMKGDFSGDVGDGLAFLLNSDLRQYLEDGLGGAEGQGPMIGRMTRGSILLPPVGESQEYETDIRLETRFLGARMYWPEWSVDLRQMSGQLVVDTRENFSSSGLQGTLFGETVLIEAGGEGEIGTSDAHTYFDLSQGRIGAADMEPYIGEWYQFLTGSTGYRGRMMIPYAPESEVTLTAVSNMKGMAVDVPTPFRKGADEEQEMNLVLRFAADAQSPVRIQMVSRSACADLLYLEDVLGGALWLNEQAACEDSWQLPRAMAPLEIRGSVDRVDVGEQVAFVGRIPVEEGDDSQLALIDVRAKQVNIGGFTFEDLPILMRPDEAGQRFVLDSEDIVGEVYVPDAADGVSLVELEYLRIPQSYGSGGLQNSSPEIVGAITMEVERLVYAGEELGQWELNTYPQPGSLRVNFEPIATNKLRLEPPLDVLEEKPYMLWQDGKTRLHFRAVAEDGSSLLRILPEGMFNRLKSASMDVSVGWPGSPADFSIHQLDGTVQLELQDTDINLSEGGAIGPLLTAASVLNIGNLINSLVTQKLHQVSGTWFRIVRAQTELQPGEINFKELLAMGSSSTIYSRGMMYLREEESPTLNMDVQLLLPVAKALPWYVMALGGLTAGVGVYLLDFILGKPLSRATTASMHMSGTLADPDIVFLDDDHRNRSASGSIWLEDYSQPYGGSVHND